MSEPVRLLIVEDETFVAMDLVMQLEDLGFVCLDPVPTVAQALAVLAEDTPDFAILDASLRGERPTEVAESLQARGIPFVYASGYGSDFIANNLPAAPLVAKPVEMDVLVGQIRTLLGLPGVEAPK